MELQGNNNMNVQDLNNVCKKMMYYHTTLRMRDGTEVDGIIVSVEPDHVIVLVGEDVTYREDENNEQRQYTNPRRVRRYRQRRIPLAELLLLSLLPYPYYVPPYPYYPPYPHYTNFPY